MPTFDRSTSLRDRECLGWSLDSVGRRTSFWKIQQNTITKLEKRTRTSRTNGVQRPQELFFWVQWKWRWCDVSLEYGQHLHCHSLLFPSLKCSLTVKRDGIWPDSLYFSSLRSGNVFLYFSRFFFSLEGKERTRGRWNLKAFNHSWRKWSKGRNCRIFPLVVLLSLSLSLWKNGWQFFTRKRRGLILSVFSTNREKYSSFKKLSLMILEEVKWRRTRSNEVHRFVASFMSIKIKEGEEEGKDEMMATKTTMMMMGVDERRRKKYRKEVWNERDKDRQREWMGINTKRNHQKGWIKKQDKKWRGRQRDS